MPDQDSVAQQIYNRALADVCRPGGDSGLPHSASLLCDELVPHGAQPQDIVALHSEAATIVLHEDMPHEAVIAQRFLLEVLVAYTSAYATVSERLLAEADAALAAQRKRGDDLERAERERLELLAGVSHELGTPLTIIRSNVASIRQFLVERASWPDELNQREEDVEFAVERMLTLRDELLAASRNEPRELEIGPLHLTRCLQRACRWARMSARDKGLELIEEYADGSPFAMGDEWAVQSIASNLLSNAVRYTPARGGPIHVRTYAERASVVMEVADAGIGMSDADQKRIYERFYRTPEAREVTAFGLGLGLAITRDLVSALAGSIAVTSKIGGGTTFRVTLPRADLPAEGTSESEAN